MGDTAATIWTSGDGRSWTASTLPGENTVAAAAAEWRQKTVVAGSVRSEEGTQAAAWVSDGPNAAYRPSEIPPSGANSQMTSVTAGPLGMFALGTVDGRLAMWSSTDGTHWTESTEAEKVFAASPSASVTSLLAEGGAVYAAGSIRDGASTDAALWTSNDGIKWHLVGGTRTAFAGAGGEKQIESLAPLTTGMVAVGTERSGSRYSPVSWISPDGVSWSRPSTAFSPTAPGQSNDSTSDIGVRSVSSYLSPSGATTLIAAGGSDTSQRVWRSTDGIEWQAVALPTGPAQSRSWRATLAAAGADGAVVADGDWGQPHLLVLGDSGWIEPSSDPRTFGPTQSVALPESATSNPAGITLVVGVTNQPQALSGSPRSARYELISRDGRSWVSRPLPATTNLPSGTRSSASSSSGWLAVVQGASGRSTVFRSADGTTWAASPTPTSPGRVSTPIAVCARGLTQVVVGASVAAPPRSTDATPSSHAASTVASTTTTTIPAASAYVPQRAQAWVRTAARWTIASAAPPPSGHGDEAMNGCTPDGSGWLAYGATSSGDGGLVPAVWKSATGRSWTRQDSNGFVADTTGPLVSAAAMGGSIVAVSANSSVAGWTYGASDIPMSDGALAQGVWIDPSNGRPWTLVDTSAPPWTGVGTSEYDLTGFVGSRPLVVGTTGNQVAVWSAALKRVQPPAQQPGPEPTSQS